MNIIYGLLIAYGIVAILGILVLLILIRKAPAECANPICDYLVPKGQIICPKCDTPLRS